MPEPPTPPRGVRPPRQARSRETLDRILEATLALLDGRDFDDVPVLEIAEAAGVSSSSLYARFPDKATLLRAVHEHHMERVHELVDRSLGERAADPRPPVEVIPELIGLYLRYQRAHEGPARTFKLAELRDPSLAARRRRVDARIIEPVRDYLLGRRAVAAGGDAAAGDPAAGRDAELRVELAVRAMAAVVQDAVHAPYRFAERLALDDERLVTELGRMMLGYLGHERS